MSTPGRLYDASASPPTLIAHVRLTTSRRAEFHGPVSHKLDDKWLGRIPSHAGIQILVTADGISASSSWRQVLMDRQDAATTSSYLVAYDDGDSHTGNFLVDTIEEYTDAENYRRFRLVLLSAGRVIYSAA